MSGIINWYGAAGGLAAISFLSIGLAVGFRFSKISVFFFDIDLAKEIAYRGNKRFFFLTGLLAISSAGCVGFGWWQSIIGTWPTQYWQLGRAELEASSVDDEMTVDLNGTRVLEAKFGDGPAWIDIRPLLVKGDNRFRIVIINGQYGGCGGKLELRLNGLKNQDFAWSWFKDVGAPANAECFNEERLLSLD